MRSPFKYPKPNFDSDIFNEMFPQNYSQIAFRGIAECFRGDGLGYLICRSTLYKEDRYAIQQDNLFYYPLFQIKILSTPFEYLGLISPFFFLLTHTYNRINNSQCLESHL